MKKFFLSLALITEIVIFILWISIVLFILIFSIAFDSDTNCNLICIITNNLRGLLFNNLRGLLFNIIIITIYLGILFSIINALQGIINLLRDKSLTTLNIFSIIVSGISLHIIWGLLSYL